MLRKASLFKETSLEFEMDREAKEKEAKERKESFDRTRAEFLAKTGECLQISVTPDEWMRRSLNKTTKMAPSFIC